MESRKSSCLRISLAAALLATPVLTLSAPSLYAQATASGTIAGTITDSSGAAIVGAVVTATNTGTNAQRTAKTATAGEYRFDLLPVGNYKIHVEAPGFSAGEVKDIDLLVGTTVAANLPLKPGSTGETVQVQALNQLVDPEKSDVSVAVTPKQITELPLNGRDFANLAILAPGVKMVDSYDPTKNRYAVYAVNGSTGRNTNTTVNGIDNKDNTVGGAVMQLPLEAVQEFIISPNRFSAANGRTEGAALNVVTKSGTNQFHGSLYGFFRTQAIQSNNYFAEKGGQPKPDYSRQQYGGAFGGPIRRDKDFGFFAYEGLRERSSISVNPDAYNDLLLVADVAKQQPNLFAVPPQPSHTIPTPFDEKRYNGRIDHIFNDKHKAFVSYTAQDNKSNNDQATARVDLTQGNFTINDLILANITLSSLFTTNTVNNFTVGFQYWNNLIDSKLRAPTITFPDTTQFGTNVNVPQKSSQHKFQFRDDLSYTHGRHTLRGGVDYLYEPQLGGFFENNPTPEFDFYANPAEILGQPQGFSTPGAVISMTGTSGDPSFLLSPKMLGLYFEDDFRMMPRLLINAGIRYDRDIDLYGLDKQKISRTHQELVAAAATGIPTVPTTVNPTTYLAGYTPDLTNIGGVFTGLPKNDNLDFSPRIGFSFDLLGNGRFVLHGGYGLYFGQTFENIPLFMIQQANDTVFANTFNINCNGPLQSCNSDQTVPGTDIVLNNYRYGIDPQPVIPPASHDLAPRSTGRIMDPSYRNPYTQQINFGFQYAPNNFSVIEVDYVQARGLHEDKTVNINPTEYFNGGVRPFSAAFVAAGVPKLGRIADEQSIGRSYYDGLNVSYRQQTWKRFTGTVNYTYAKALGFEGGAASFRNTATNPFLGQFRRQDYGATPSDERHHVTASATLNLPWKVAVSPIFQIGTGRPVDVVQSSSDLWGIGSGRTNPHAVVPIGASLTKPASYEALAGIGAGTGVDEYAGCLAARTCQEVSYANYRGPAFVELDARIGKTITIADRYNVNLFFQGFDLTNRANFGSNLDNVVGDFDPDPSVNTFLKPIDFITPNSTVLPKSFTGEFGARFSF
ncbi:MAG: carboxypeptidase regulatory-like domain-containing protein [Acidobacteriaceae bacterium]